MEQMELKKKDVSGIYANISFIQDEIDNVNINITTLNEKLAHVLRPVETTAEPSAGDSLTREAESPLANTLYSVFYSIACINNSLRFLISRIDL